MARSSARGATPVTFLVEDVCGGAGVARSLANLANQLSMTHPVRVISFHRRRRTPRFALDPSIELTFVRDLRVQEGWLKARLASVPSRLRPTPSRRQMSALTDLLLWRALRRVEGGVLISTRPSLHLAAAAFARKSVLTIGWDHLNFPRRSTRVAQFEVLRRAVPRLTAFVVLTDEDRSDYRRALPPMSTDVRVIHNSVTWAPAPVPPALDAKVVVAAGRLVPHKGFDRLIRAFARVASDHPDWQLHVYGRGPERGRLRALIQERGVGGQVKLKGYEPDFRFVLQGASIYAMGSHREGFPMVLIEALSVGLPLLAFDCPRGPAEIISHRGNGLLVPDGDLRAYRHAMGRLMSNPGLRRRLGAQALVDAQKYTVGSVAADWESLFADLAEPGARGRAADR